MPILRIIKTNLRRNIESGDCMNILLFFFGTKVIWRYNMNLNLDLKNE